MRFIWLIMLLALTAPALAVQQYYEIPITSNNDVLSAGTISVALLDAAPPAGGDYTASTVSAAGNILYSQPMDLSRTEYFDTVDENGTVNGGGTTVLQNLTTTLIIPYNESATRIDISDGNGTVQLTIDVSRYARTRTGPPSATRNEIRANESVTNTLHPTIPQNERSSSNAGLIVAAIIVILLVAGILIYRRMQQRT